jgi:hypothetical protein
MKLKRTVQSRFYRRKKCETKKTSSTTVSICTLFQAFFSPKQKSDFPQRIKTDIILTHLAHPKSPLDMPDLFVCTQAWVDQRVNKALQVMSVDTNREKRIYHWSKQKRLETG